MKLLSPSATMTINAIAKKKRMQGEHVYNFAAGDPVLKNHSAIIKRAADHVETAHCPYPPIEGLPLLRKLMANWVNTTCHTHYSQENVLVTCGGKFALFAALYSLLQMGDEVLIPAPFWVSYPDIVTMAGGTFRIIPTTFEQKWKLTKVELLKHITKNSKFLIFNNACNPTGVIYTKEEIQDLLSIAHQFGITVIADEVYSGLVYEEPGFISCGAFSEFRDKVILVQSCSKNFGMTGWRVGFILANEAIIKQLSLLQSQSTTGVSMASQWAAIGALENAVEVNNYVKIAMKKRRDLFVDTYHSLFSLPMQPISSALYAFISLSALKGPKRMDSITFCERILESDNIALVPGKAFGVEGYVRLAFSESEEDIYQGLHLLKEAIRRI